jgi:hypothetical protein
MEFKWKSIDYPNSQLANGRLASVSVYLDFVSRLWDEARMRRSLLMLCSSAGQCARRCPNTPSTSPTIPFFILREFHGPRFRSQSFSFLLTTSQPH